VIRGCDGSLARSLRPTRQRRIFEQAQYHQAQLPLAVAMASLKRLIEELKRRRVFRVAVMYAVVAFVVWQVAEIAVPGLNLPDWVLTLVILLTVLGFPIALALAWAFDIAPEGVRRTQPAGARPDAVVAPPPDVPPVKKSIVVLPFDNMSPDPNDAYFADGLTEEIITSLSHLHSLRVISRNSAMALKGTQKDTRAIAEKLDVQYVLEGSVRKAGNDLRITAQLIDAKTDAHLWAEKYEGVLDDVFEVQDRVSESIVDALNLTFSSDEKEKLLERPIENPHAYECYLRARHNLSLSTRESFKQAISTLENGLRLFGDNALLLATLGEAYWLHIDFGYETDQTYLDRAAELAERALSLDPGSAHGKNLLASLQRARGDLTTASRLMMEAHRAEPNDVGILVYAAWYSALYVGQKSVSNVLFEKLLRIDPLTPFNYFIYGTAHLEWGEYRGALDYIRKAQDMDLEFPWSRFWVSYCLAALGQPEEAIQELESALEVGLPEPTAPLARFLLWALHGNPEQALAALDPKTREYAWKDPDFSALLPGIFAYMDETDRALEWLQHALDRGNINYPLFASNDVLLENVRGEPRFQEIMASLKPKWEAFEF